jgi:phage gpG-like protein
VTNVQIIITDTELQGQLSSLTNKLADLTTPLTDSGEYLLRRTRHRFDSESAPDGSKWKELKQSTIKAKQRRQRTGKPYRTNASPTAILKDTFTLRDSITYQIANKQDLAVGTNIQYGVYNQATRPFIGLDENDRNEIVEIFRDYLNTP